MTEWWDQQTAAWIGALGGGGLGTLAGLFGGLAGYLAPRGIGRVPVLAVHGLFVLAGVGALVAGIVAVVQSQPYHVYYPLLLGGAILSLVMGVLLPVVRVRYRQAEKRKLDAEELRRG